MADRSKITILIIVIILLLIGFGVYSGFIHNDTVSVGNLNFNVPEGYHEGVLNHLGHVNLTNGTHSIFIGKFSDENNVQTYPNSYVNERAKYNDTITTSNLTIGNQKVYKAVNMNSGASHYWFSSNGDVYTIYSWDKISNMDEIVTNLVNSMHP